jgi:GNAT superfamily N-acetyltransferase
VAVIRRAVPDDEGGVLDCLRLAFEPYRSAYTPAGFIDTTLTPETLRRRMAVMTVLVAEGEDGIIAGTIACGVHDDGRGHLRGMAVLPVHLGQGIADRLLDAAERTLAASGCAIVTLDTTEPLRRAIRFYEKHGYRPSRCSNTQKRSEHSR